MIPEEAAGASQATVAPLPVSNLTDLLGSSSDPSDADDASGDIDNQELSEPNPGETQKEPPPKMPPSLADRAEETGSEWMPEFASDLDSLLADAFDDQAASVAANPSLEEPGAEQAADAAEGRADAASREVADANAARQPTGPASAPRPTVWSPVSSPATLRTESAPRKSRLCCEPVAVSKPKRQSNPPCSFWLPTSAPTAPGILDLPGPVSNGHRWARPVAERGRAPKQRLPVWPY